MGRSTRGEFNLLWIVVTVVGITMAIVILYLVYGGAMRSLGMTNFLSGQATTTGDQLIINLKTTGVGTITIDSVTLYAGNSAVTSGCSLSSVTLNGNSISTTLPWSLKPGDTLSLIYTGSNCTNVTYVDVSTSTGSQSIQVT
ncbi:hypothetical protein [Vulcanisaeta souniana]|uniref:Archaeal Type IV pilin N-terminal domain-containing protein n=1 Tax=Vulcanisaeta souniana JCM 11219 TaxID=1293586 RepID=A0A830EEV5_9CREN|nr:hypothetical protein [Vulcanisaeta souniana]BDR93210.1 hypothetical protein Vsou_23030 [Vulcanisaeta souniana JCM 11219]GGI78427.1 hypothetical protein GCM10007112_14110 [Vulcanisaeta souniana JCM 11219]